MEKRKFQRARDRIQAYAERQSYQKVYALEPIKVTDVGERRSWKETISTKQENVEKRFPLADRTEKSIVLRGQRRYLRQHQLPQWTRSQIWDATQAVLDQIDKRLATQFETQTREYEKRKVYNEDANKIRLEAKQTLCKARWLRADRVLDKAARQGPPRSTSLHLRVDHENSTSFVTGEEYFKHYKALVEKRNGQMIEKEKKKISPIPFVISTEFVSKLSSFHAKFQAKPEFRRLLWSCVVVVGKSDSTLRNTLLGTLEKIGFTNLISLAPRDCLGRLLELSLYSKISYIILVDSESINQLELLRASSLAHHLPIGLVVSSPQDSYHYLSKVNLFPSSSLSSHPFTRLPVLWQRRNLSRSQMLDWCIHLTHPHLSLSTHSHIAEEWSQIVHLYSQDTSFSALTQCNQRQTHLINLIVSNGQTNPGN